MHEYALSRNLFDLVEQEISARQVATPRAVTVKLGNLLAVNHEAFRLGFELASHGTALQQIKLNIENIAGRAHCRACGESYPMSEWYSPCEHCGSFDRDVLAGEEFHLVNMELE